MKGAFVCLCPLWLMIACAPPSGSASGDHINVLEFAREFERVASGQTAWPGFDPLLIPLAVYDGTQTYLFRHPAPPEGFAEVPGAVPAAYKYGGRYPAVVANSSAEIGGVGTATVMLDKAAGGGTLLDQAGLSLHEAFHVYQRSNYPGWAGNEADAFVYPVEDPALLALRRMGIEALQRAFAARDADEHACWVERALEARWERYARMDAASVAYERGTELNEGLATYVQYRFTGRAVPEFPEGGFPVGDVRRRAYVTGLAIALLLDRHDPAWREALDEDPGQHLDARLAGSLERTDSHDCAFAEDERAAFHAAARRDVEALLTQRVQRRKEYESRPGWRLVIDADGRDPLFPQGFDPINLSRVEGGVLHTRFLKLGNSLGALEIMDGAALTEGVGPHPMFNGVRRLLLAGLPDAPEVTENEDIVVISAPGLSAEFRGARVERADRTIHVRLSGPDGG